MTVQFHKGQEVEVKGRPDGWGNPTWRKAKIFRNREKSGHLAFGYEVKFPDGTGAVFDADHIKVIEEKI